MKHGHSGKRWQSPTYISWAGMVKRCTNANNPGYRLYGARGITVCDRWRKFENFLEDMGVRPDGLTLERINNNEGYSQSNCKWATPAEQQRNRRDNNKYTFRGMTMILPDWAEKTGIDFEVLRGRFNLGWPAELALTLPATKSNSVLRKSRVYPKRNASGQYIKESL